MNDDVYVEWFKKTINKFYEGILVQKTYMNEILKLKAERVILGKQVYDWLSKGYELKNNMICDLPIAIDCEDDWLIAVCHGTKQNGKSLVEEIEDEVE